ncbi:MAG: hypothetical protein IKU25_08845 [Clostridia bacterium]|nr:hypothetical protein [Clostridia bacterium]
MRLLRYEFRKLFCKKAVFICLALFLVINVYKISTLPERENITSYDEYFSGYDAVYDIVKGEMTEEKILFVVENYQELSALNEQNAFSNDPNENRFTRYDFGDYIVFMQFFNGMDYAYNYSTNMSGYINLAKENVDFFLERGNEYEASVNQQIVDIYGGRGISAYYDTYGFSEFFEYDFSSLLIILLLLLSLASSFTMESESGMDMLIKISKKGRQHTVMAKTGAFVLFGFFITVLFTAVDLIAFDIKFGLDGFFNPIYSIERYFTFTLNLSIFGYVMLSMVLKFIAFTVIGLFIMFCSSLFGSVVYSFGVGTFAVFGIILADGTTKLGASKFLALLNPLSLIANRYMLDTYSVVNIFDYPVLKIYVALIAMLIFAMVLIVGIMFAYSRRSIGTKKLSLKMFKLHTGGAVG